MVGYDAGMDWTDEFPLEPGLIYLNHAAVAPWPRRATLAVQRFAEENMRQGAKDYPRWLGVEIQLKQRLSRLINAASPDDIALLKNTSEALSLVAWGLAWQAGDNIVTSNQEFPSNRIPWESLAPLGVTLRQVDLAGNASPEDALLAACDGRTRLLTVSSIQFASGLRLDLVRLGRACRQRGILFCVDAIQSLGAVQFDARTCEADVVMADGHKWLLGPEGIALFWCRPELRQRLKLHEYGWHMVDAVGNYDRHDWQPAATARRFECGSPNMLGIHALEASLALLEQIGLDVVEHHVLANAEWLLERLGNDPRYELVTDPASGRYGGIVSFRPRRMEVAPLFRELTHRGVVCAMRSGAIRFSAHFYTPRSQLMRALDLLDTVMQQA